MNKPSHAFQRRLTLLVVGLVVAVALCVSLALTVYHVANEKLQQLAQVELEAASLARQFRAAVDDLHGALLRIGTDTPDECAEVIRQRRLNLTDWLRTRRAARLNPKEQNVVAHIAAELRAYFVKLDSLLATTNGLNHPLDREMVVMFDDSANRLQSIADDFAAAHDQELRVLLQASLSSLSWMRNLVFACLALLLVAITVVVALLYRDVVRPLRAQLIDSETLLAKREKLAALGTLAAGVAHEIRNPLTAIKARLYTLRRIPAPPESKQDVQAITSEVDRLEHIVRDVLGYARPDESNFNMVELATWLRDFSAFVEPELKAANILLTVNAVVTAKVRIDSNQLRQIMLNLVRNAQEAFETRPGQIELALLRERTLLHGKSTEAAVLAVTDNGPGIPAKIQARLFDPFFTTKPAGTGLGLSIVARLVELQGGEIIFQSAPSIGTRFTVRLPLPDESRQTVEK